jgi:hypothetical protein
MTAMEPAKLELAVLIREAPADRACCRRCAVSRPYVHNSWAFKTFPSSNV